MCLSRCGGQTVKPTTIHFKTHFQCAYGEQLKLVGDKEELGNWDLGSAPTLTWTSGDAWEAAVKLDEAEQAKFKLVHMSHEGAIWEPIGDRVLPAVREVGSPEMEVDLAWGMEGYRIAAERVNQQVEASPISAAEQFDLLWNPPNLANVAPSPPKSPTNQTRLRKLSCDVTLEPEWGVLDLDDAHPRVDATEQSVERGQNLEFTVLAGDTQSQEVQPASAIPNVPQTGVDRSAKSPVQRNSKHADRGLVKKKKKSKGQKLQTRSRQPSQKSGLQVLFENAHHFATAGVAAALLSAVGLHGQDVFFGSATLATGAALLSDVNTTKKELQNFDAKQSVVPVIEGIGKAVLKAADVLQNVHQSVQSDLAKKRTAAQASLSEPNIEDIVVENFKGNLTEYVAQLTAEATQFAMNFPLTEKGEKGIQSSPAPETESESAASNIVVAKGIKASEKISN